MEMARVLWTFVKLLLHCMQVAISDMLFYTAPLELKLVELINISLLKVCPWLEIIFSNLRTVIWILPIQHH